MKARSLKLCSPKANFRKVDRPDSGLLSKSPLQPTFNESLLCVADDGSNPLWPWARVGVYLTVGATPVTFCSMIPIERAELKSILSLIL